MELLQNTVVIKVRNSVDGENSRLDTPEMRVHEWKMALRQHPEMCRNMQLSDSTMEEIKRFNTLTHVIKFPGEKPQKTETVSGEITSKTFPLIKRKDRIYDN